MLQASFLQVQKQLYAFDMRWDGLMTNDKTGSIRLHCAPLLKYYCVLLYLVN